jgi:hypothetical protein
MCAKSEHAVCSRNSEAFSSFIYVSSVWYYCVQVFELKQWPSKLVDMEQWGVRESVHAVELFIQTGSVTETQRGFRRELNQLEAPSPNAVH